MWSASCGLQFVSGEKVRKVLQRGMKPIKKVLQVGLPGNQALETDIGWKKFSKECLKDQHRSKKVCRERPHRVS